MKKKIIAAFLTVLVMSLFISCNPDKSRTVRFYASSSSGEVSGNYLWSGGASVFSDKPSPWHIDVETEEGDYVVMMATNSSGIGTVVARIYVDGELFRENTGQDMDIIQVAGFIE
jgi:hypothetical protein